MNTLSSISAPHNDGHGSTTTGIDFEQLPPQAYSLLKVLAVLNPDRIQEELLRKGVKEVELPDYPKTNKTYFDARADLIQSSLVKLNMETNELSIHRLVQDVVRERLALDELHDVFAATAVLLVAVWPFVSGTDPTRNQAWRIPICEKYSPHINRLAVLFGPSIRAKEYVGTVKGAAVFSSYSWYMAEQGFPDQCEVFAAYAQIILEAAQKDGRGDEKEVTGLLADCHHNQSFSAIYTDSGGAMEHAKAWLAILLDRIEKWHLDEDALSLATAYNQIALCHIHKDEVDEAISSWSRSLDAYRTAPNAPKLSGIWPATSLALIYTIENQPTEANDVLTPVLKERDQVLGKDDKTTSESGAVWRAMGKIRIRQEQYDEGLDYLHRAAENLKATLGENHYMTGDCFYEIGLEFLRKRDTDTAVQHLDAAMKAFGDAPWRKAQTARVLWKKGKVARAGGNGAEGDALINRAMEIRKEVVPEDKRPEEQLTDADWDKIVFYSSR